MDRIVVGVGRFPDVFGDVVVFGALVPVVVAVTFDAVVLVVVPSKKTRFGLAALVRSGSTGTSALAARKRG